jgi:hypothetical protein
MPSSKAFTPLDAVASRSDDIALADCNTEVAAQKNAKIVIGQLSFDIQ